MHEITYKIDLYEGPLDLLLALVNKNKMDIADIPIAEICSQYMDYLEQAERLDMDLTADFIVMASELMYIKSKMLLPKLTIEDEEDPRASLAEALLRYQCAKEAAALLAPLYEQYAGRMAKDTDEIKPDNSPPTGLDPVSLSKIMRLLLIRNKANETAPGTIISPLVKYKIVPVSEMVEKIIGSMSTRPSQSLLSLLLTCAESKSALVAAFLGILELIKERKILVCPLDDDEAEDNLDDIKLKWNDEARSA
ncbi:MAG: segregation/condensation protein A [Clostridiales bacterium]|nr:segregation/condensation protein A [Clostridiales bacterium]